MDFTSITQGWEKAHPVNLKSNSIKASRQQTWGTQKVLIVFQMFPPKGEPLREVSLSCTLPPVLHPCPGQVFPCPAPPPQQRLAKNPNWKPDYEEEGLEEGVEGHMN